MLVGGNRCDFDRILAESMKDICLQKKQNLDSHLVSYVLNNQRAYFHFGRVFKSRITSWDPGEGANFIPEPFQLADVLILVKEGEVPAEQHIGPIGQSVLYSR
jgi:hypothetical protein